MVAETLTTMKHPIKMVPDVVVRRLPIYLRALSLLAQEGKDVTSSQELGRRLGISSAQIRKDLSHFGEFGKQGTGYRIDFLQHQLMSILNLDKPWAVALVGFGDLGHAILQYSGFSDKGFQITIVFDNNPHKVGQVVNGLTIQPVSELISTIQAEKIQIAILAVPLQAAQKTATILVEAGIKAILNYAPLSLVVPPEVQVQNIDPVAHLQQMTYYLDHQ